MENANQKGFSLVELLLVVVIIGIIASIGIPALQKGIRAAENGAVFGTMRTVASTQVNFFTANGRFGRLDEVNAAMSRGIGRSVGPNQVERSQFMFEMVPASPTDTELREGYTITATRQVTGDTNIYQFEVNQSGYITQVLPGPLDY